MLYEAYRFYVRVTRRAMMIAKRRFFFSAGRNFTFDPTGRYSFRNISVGDDVYFGPGCVLVASRARICIGSKVMLGPGVTIVAGNHRTDLIGRFMFDVRDQEKLPEHDIGVVIEDDVWIGANAVLTDGVTIRRGGVVAAGAVVTASTEPYAIVAGVPARVVRYRWNPEALAMHEAALQSTK